MDPIHVGLVFLTGPLTYMILSLVVGPISDALVSYYSSSLRYMYYQYTCTHALDFREGGISYLLALFSLVLGIF